MPETEDQIPQEARDFKAPPDGEKNKESARKPGSPRSREEWTAQFATQEPWVLERTKDILERRLAIPNSKDNFLPEEARQEGAMQIELIKAELEKRNAQKQ